MTWMRTGAPVPRRYEFGQSDLPSRAAFTKNTSEPFMNNQKPEKPVFWAEISLAIYWVLTAALMVGAPLATPDSIRQALWQLVAMLGLASFTAWGYRNPNRVFLRWLPWPFLLMWTYLSVDAVQEALNLPLHDDFLQACEQWIWGFSPAMEWSISWNWLIFSEFLHFCYLSYMLNFAITVFRAGRNRSEAHGRVALSAGVLALLACYCGNGLYPALGPRHILPPLAENLHGPFWKMVHAAMKDGAAAAAAFPSGHCALSTATAVMAYKLDKRYFPIALIWSVGTICATVYGRFHYSVDSFAGVFLGLLASWAVLRRYRQFEEA